MSKLLSICFVSIFILISCSSEKSNNPNEPGNENEDWSYGETKSYDVATSEAYYISDNITGLSFNFPSGGNGTLLVKEIKSGVSLDFDATKFEVTFTGIEPVQLQVTKTANEEIVLFGYFQIQNTVLDGSEEYENWWGIPSTAESNGIVTFSLQPEWSLGKTKNVTADVSKFAVSKLQPGSNVWQQTQAVRQTVLQCIETWLNNLPANLRALAQTQINGNLRYSIVWSNSGNAYVHGNNWIASNAIFNFRREAQLSSIAHEVGHYMHHVLCGYAEYNDMYNRFPHDFWGSALPHDLGSYREGRAEILEEYPYFSQYMITGNLDNFDPLNTVLANNVYHLCNSKYPDQVDYPSHEGFSVWLLASLMRTENQIYTFRTNIPRATVPVIGASFTDMLQILASGPDNINQLRELANAYLAVRGGDYQYMLPAILEPIGWSYNGIGYVVDENDQPITDATIISVCKVGAKEYFTRKSTMSGTDGRVYLDRIFPGTNTLRVYYNSGSDSSDSPFTANWNTLTNTTLDLGKITVTTTDVNSILKITEEVFGNLTNTYETEFEVEINNTGKYFSDNFDTSYTEIHDRYYFQPEFWRSPVYWDVVQPLSWSGNSFSSSFVYNEDAGYETRMVESTITGSVSSDGKTLVSAKQIYKYTTKSESEHGYYGGYDYKQKVTEQILEFKNLPLVNYQELDQWGYAGVTYFIPDYNSNKEKADISYVITEDYIGRNQSGMDIYTYHYTETLKRIITGNGSGINVSFSKSP